VFNSIKKYKKHVSKFFFGLGFKSHGDFSALLSDEHGAQAPTASYHLEPPGRRPRGYMSEKGNKRETRTRKPKLQGGKLLQKQQG
jgi:hypothetical protein